MTEKTATGATNTDDGRARGLPPASEINPIDGDCTMRHEVKHTAASWLAVVQAATHESSGYQRLWIETFLVLPPEADAMIRNRNAECAA